MNDSIDDLSVEELRERLLRVESDRAYLEQALEARKEAGKQELADEIRELIQSRGYSVDEILELLQGRRRRRTRASSTPRIYPRYVDPDNPDNVYTRGVLPGWMKEKMVANGLDPASAEDRKTFKEKYLRRESD